MVVTNHAPLQWLQCMKETNPQLMRWYLALQPYKFTLYYQRGLYHANADFFSHQAVWAAIDQQASLEGEMCEPPADKPPREAPAEQQPPSQSRQECLVSSQATQADMPTTTWDGQELLHQLY